MRTPRKGSLLRRIFDAAHARWCGPECPSSCREWHPDLEELRAIARTVEPSAEYVRSLEAFVAKVAQHPTEHRWEARAVLDARPIV